MRILYAYDLVMEGYDASRAAQSATTAVQQTLTRGAKSPAFGVAMIACLIYASVDGAGAPPFPLTKSTVHDAADHPGGRGRPGLPRPDRPAGRRRRGTRRSASTSPKAPRRLPRRPSS